MIQSMTGFATKTISIVKDKDHKAHISIHLKSLNARYFEVNAKLPSALTHLETDLIKLFKKNLHRGYVYFTVHVDNPSIFKGAIEPSLGMVQGYVKSLKKIQKEFKLEDQVSLKMIARLPHVFNVEEATLDKKSTDTILKVAKQLIETVIHERIKEGKNLQIDIEKRVAFMKKEITSIAKRSQAIIELHKKKVNGVLEDLKGDANELADARKSALFSMLDKIDIHEEIVRFESHLKNISKQLKGAPVENGKRLDFTLQELAREINTITAKCADSQISQDAINIKVEIEKAREQAQNIV